MPTKRLLGRSCCCIYCQSISAALSSRGCPPLPPRGPRKLFCLHVPTLCVAFLPQFPWVNSLGCCPGVRWGGLQHTPAQQHPLVLVANQTYTATGVVCRIVAPQPWVSLPTPHCPPAGLCMGGPRGTQQPQAAGAGPDPSTLGCPWVPPGAPQPLQSTALTSRCCWVAREKGGVCGGDAFSG